MSASGRQPFTKSSSTNSLLGSGWGTLGGASAATSRIPVVALQLRRLVVVEHGRDRAVQRGLRDVARRERDVLEPAVEPLERRDLVVEVLRLLLALGRRQLLRLHD